MISKLAALISLCTFLLMCPFCNILWGYILPVFCLMVLAGFSRLHVSTPINDGAYVILICVSFFLYIFVLFGFYALSVFCARARVGGWPDSGRHWDYYGARFGFFQWRMVHLPNILRRPWWWSGISHRCDFCPAYFAVLQMIYFLLASLSSGFSQVVSDKEGSVVYVYSTWYAYL